MSTNEQTPAELDTKLAELYYEAQKIQQRIAWSENTLKQAAGAEYYYRGRRRVTNMAIEDAITVIEERLANPTDEYQLNLTRGFYLMEHARRDLDKHAALVAELKTNRDQAFELERSYTGWSRFFLVTSSKGHIHSSMSCSTCRPSTQYGWRPDLSGQTEAEAVKALGPALCSVCFPSAPVEWTEDKLTKAQAEKAAH